MDLKTRVQFHGRWNLDNEDRYNTSWCGSSLIFQTTSRYVDVELGERTASRKNYHNILWQFGSQSLVKTLPVKGKRMLKITPSDQVEPGYAGDDLREVIIMLCDWGATLQILSISSADGQPITIKPTQGSTWPMLFIGASQVSGYSPPFRGLVLPYGTYQAFGSVVVRTLRSHGVDALLEMVAYPGLCLTSSDYEEGMVDIFWKGMHGQDGWDFRSRDNPHDIFICIGSNDQSFLTDKDKFLQTYRDFLNRLRNAYSTGLKRIHVISPFGFFTDPTAPRKRKTVYEPEVQHMVEELSKEWKTRHTEPKLFHISTEGWIDMTLTCDGIHPTVEGHEAIGRRLVDYIASLDLDDAD